MPSNTQDDLSDELSTAQADIIIPTAFICNQERIMKVEQSPALHQLFDSEREQNATVGETTLSSIIFG